MEFNNFEQNTKAALDDCKGAVKQCSKNAIHHLEKAWIIRETDMEMSVFRGITAEEEAASSLFHCLKNHRYKNADKIQFRQHKYKLGVFPFLVAISNFIGGSKTPFENITLRHTEKSRRKAIELLLYIPSTNQTAQPEPPLHFSVTDPKTGAIRNFNKEFEDLVSNHGFNDNVKYIKDTANKRNQLIYADETGRPFVKSGVPEFLLEQKRKVMNILTILLMIDPWEKEYGSSMFVQQALDSFLLLQNRIKPEDIEMPNQSPQTTCESARV